MDDDGIEFILLTPEQARDAIADYPNGLVLFNRFWSFMRAQRRRGASEQYVVECFEVLADEWDRRHLPESSN